MSSSKADEALCQQNLILEGINRILHCALTSATEEELGTVCLAVAEQITEGASRGGACSDLPSTSRYGERMGGRQAQGRHSHRRHPAGASGGHEKRVRP